MPAVFDRKELLKLLRDFHVLTGIRAAMLDAWGIDMLSYPDHLPEYCRLVRQTEAGRTACLQCDQNACRQARNGAGALRRLLGLFTDSSLTNSVKYDILP